MDPITDIDAETFAAAAAYAAAQKLFALFEDAAAEADYWCDPVLPAPAPSTEEVDGQTLAAEAARAAGAIIGRLAHFALEEQAFNPETLWRWGTAQGLVVRSAGHFNALPFPRRAAWGLFASVVRDVARAIAHAQTAAAAEGARVVFRPLALEDSILEEHGRLDEKLEGFSSPPSATPSAPRPVGTPVPTEPHQAPPAAQSGRAPKAVGPEGQSVVEKRPKARSAGQTSASPPVNRGGRGKRKPARDRKPAP